MRHLFIIALLASTACAHRNLHTWCVYQAAPSTRLDCVQQETTGFDRPFEENAKLVAINGCVMQRQRALPTEPFAESVSRCDLTIMAKMAAAKTN